MCRKSTGAQPTTNILSRLLVVNVTMGLVSNQLGHGHQLGAHDGHGLNPELRAFRLCAHDLGV